MRTNAIIVPFSRIAVITKNLIPVWKIISTQISVLDVYALKWFFIQFFKFSISTACYVLNGEKCKFVLTTTSTLRLFSAKCLSVSILNFNLSTLIWIALSTKLFVSSQPSK